jgi:DNA-directed RNA polymerase I and III subunit RPAC1
MNEALAKMRDITITEFEMLHTSTPPDFGGNPGKNGNNIVSNFKKRLRAENFQRPDPMELEFDLIGVDPSLANALRRIMISEVPSMAIEKVFIYNNTSIIQDEVLAHRLGLIPLKADPRFFDWKPAKPSSGAARLDDEEMVKEAEGTPNDTAVYELKIRCKNNPDAPTGSKSSKDLFIDTNVYSSSIKPMAKPGQPNDLGPVQDDILIAKLRPGMCT